MQCFCQASCQVIKSAVDTFLDRSWNVPDCSQHQHCSSVVVSMYFVRDLQCLTW